MELQAYGTCIGLVSTIMVSVLPTPAGSGFTHQPNKDTLKDQLHPSIVYLCNMTLYLPAATDGLY